ncbi:endolytic transglycosylase MltG, partial [Glutamicibacter sp.]|uniref:endolytic transglycosylase MltG n=1 Tax=Glutamicibacter sp. TaxID=1931995 RepID=UPI002FE06D62
SLQFSKAEKQDAANKYNTYVHQGLPPTPIGSPATSAINAAANPQTNDYYYWVTVNIETGETKFASTYAQHQQNQAEFRSWCEQNPGVC